MKLENKKGGKDEDVGPGSALRKNSKGALFRSARDRYQLSVPLRLPPKYDRDESYGWADFLDIPELVTPAVYNFSSAPLNDVWQHIAPGMKLEVLNPDYSANSPLGAVYWIAQAIRICGYKALMRYEGSSTGDPNHEFWVNLCCANVHPVGWCAEKTRPLVPPKSIQDQHPDKKTAQDWKSFLAKRLTGARTLPLEFHDRVAKALTSRFKPGMRFEVTDRKKLCQVKPAIILEVIGHRLRVKYTEISGKITPDQLLSLSSSSDDDYEPPDDEFWTHERSPLVHHVGWAASVGHEIDASQNYKDLSLQKYTTGSYDPDDATPDMFDKPDKLHASAALGSGLFSFSVGMKLEAIDPLDLSSIVCGTIDRVLDEGYLMIRFDGAGDSFCYHQSSPCIFPVGFCQQHSIRLKPPRGSSSKFDWPDYLKQTKSVAAPVALFNTELVNHKFRVGMKLEATDLMDPRLICVATVADVKGRLLRIHFDGWEDTFDQWNDCYAPETYPIGWCEMTGYKLEAPKSETPSPQKKRPKSLQTKLRKKKKVKLDSDASGEFASMDDEPGADSASTVASSVGVFNSELPEILTPKSDEGEALLLEGWPSVQQWSAKQVCQFLDLNGSSAISKKFKNMDGKTFLQLQANDFQSMAIGQSQMERIMQLIKYLHTTIL